MCPGLPEEKASLLFDLVIGQYAEIEIQRIRKKHDDAIKKLRKVQEKYGLEDGKEPEKQKQGFFSKILGSKESK